MNNGQVIVVKNSEKNIIHCHNKAMAIRYDGCLGLIIRRYDTKPWISIYEVLIGMNMIDFGRGWIIPVDSYYCEHTKIYRACR